MADERSVTFAGLERWFDELPDDTRRRMLAWRDEAARHAAGARLVPVEHGPGLADQLRAGAKRFAATPDPFALIRVSDSELGLVGAGLLPESALQPIDWYEYRGGFDRDAIAQRATYLTAIRGAELVGLQQNWAPVTEATAVLLRMLGIALPMPNGVEVHLPYHLLVTGELFARLAGRRVALIGWLAPRLADVWATPAFTAAHDRFGPIGEIDVVAAVSMPSRDQGGASRGYERALSAVDHLDFDVALLACGVAAKPLAWEIRERGRTALDVGFVFNALLGDRERERRPVLRDVSWPAGYWMRDV